jgi:beta-glucosidase
VLCGDVNPAGRLPHTIYAAESQVPPPDEYDISQGFTYMYLHGEPLFAFGHGLSDSACTCSKLRVSQEQVSAADALAVSVDVANMGPRAGDEVAQLYVRAVTSHVKRPAKELRDFPRLTLQPGERQTVRFVVPAAKLAFWDDVQHAFVVEPGMYQFLVGASSSDIRATATVHVRSIP